MYRTLRTSNIRKLHVQCDDISGKKSVNIPKASKKNIVSHASILFVLKEFISRTKGFVIKLYVVSSSFLTSPPNMRGDLTIAHKVICKEKTCIKSSIKKAYLLHWTDTHLELHIHT